MPPRRSLWKLAAAVGAASALALPGRTASADTISVPAGAPTLTRALLADLNRIRARNGLQPLLLSRQLAAAAAAHSAEMLFDGYFSHSSADGSAYWRRIEQFYPVLPRDSWSVGENLLWAVGGIDAGHAIRLWMASPEHRHNILSPSWRQVGIAVRADDAAPGVFDGKRVCVLTIDFGTRA